MILAACKPVATTEPPAVVTEAPKPTEAPTEAPVVVEPTEEPVVRTTRHGGWFDEVVITVVDVASAVTQIQAGALDIYAAGVSSKTLPEIQAAGLGYAESNGLYYELTFNPVGPTFEGQEDQVNPFFDKRAREAMNWLVDRDYINREVYMGGALARFFPVVTNMPDYTSVAPVAKALESKYAYDLARADAQMEAVMLGIEGVTREGGKYMFAGNPVTLSLLIRNDSDGTRVPIGDYVANQLESIGFATDRQYKRSSEASPIWVRGNPADAADGVFHIYTGAWSATGISRNEADNFQFFDCPTSAYGFTALWQANNVSAEYVALADKLAYTQFDTPEERLEALNTILPMMMEESMHVWLIDGKNFTPYADHLSVTYDLAAGVDGSQIWPYTLRETDVEGGTLHWGAPDLFVDPINPVAGSNWAFDQPIVRATYDEGYMLDPFTGLIWPFRFDRAEVTVLEGLPVGKTNDWVALHFADEITVPVDAIVDWDAVNQQFITAAEKFPEGITAKVKSVVYYPEDLFETVKNQDGTLMSIADFYFAWILGLDIGKEGSAIYDAAQAPNIEAALEAYKGFRFISEDPLVVEAWTDNWQIDAENNITTMWPVYTYGYAPWHTMAAAMLADAAGELAFSADKADANSTDTTNVEWLSLIGGPSLGILDKYLDQAIADKYVPYAGILGKYITPEDAVARYQAAKAFYDKYDHFMVGNGPYILGEVYLTEKVATLVNNPNYIDLSDRWNQFSEPRLAVVEVDGAGSAPLSSAIVFDVFVTFDDDPYPADDIKEVKGLLYDATGAIVAVLDAELVEDGYYTVTVPADVAAKMEAGASKIDIVVVSKVVAIPTFFTFEFVTIK
jgi:peptide/nickel transport system substrate-binding protein